MDPDLRSGPLHRWIRLKIALRNPEIWKLEGRRNGRSPLIGGRDSPQEVFDPWVRWDLGLDRIRSFRVVALSCCRVVVLSCCRVVVLLRCRVVVLSRCRVVIKMDLSEEHVPVLVPDL